MRLPHRFVVTLVGLSLAAAGCGSTSDGSGSSKPIKLGVMTGVQTNAISQPWIAQAAKIAAASINSSGGITGRRVQIDLCDDHSTPQGAALCAQKLLVQDKVLMMVGDDGTMEPALIPTLKVGKPISWASLGASLDSLKRDRVYVLEPVLVQYWIKQGGADTAVIAVNPGQISSLIQTCHQIGLTRLLWAIPSIEMTPQVVRTVTELKQPNITVLAHGKPAVDGFAADIAKYGPSVGGTTNTTADGAINAWLGVKLLAKVIPAVGSADAVAIKMWLDKQSALSTGNATAPINFTTSPVAALPRIKNISATKGEISNGTLVLTDPTPFTIKRP